MSRVAWTPKAESDLDDVLYYIAFIDRRPATGERIYYEIRDRINMHAAKRLPGHVHPKAPSGWRYIKHMRWLIF